MKKTSIIILIIIFIIIITSFLYKNDNKDNHIEKLIQNGEIINETSNIDIEKNKFSNGKYDEFGNKIEK